MQQRSNPHTYELNMAQKAEHLIGSESQFWSPLISTFNELDFVHTVMKLFHLYLIKNQLAYKYRNAWKCTFIMVLVWNEAFSHSELTKMHLRKLQGILTRNNSLKHGQLDGQKFNNYKISTVILVPTLYYVLYLCRTQMRKSMHTHLYYKSCYSQIIVSSCELIRRHQNQSIRVQIKYWINEWIILYNQFFSMNLLIQFMNHTAQVELPELITNSLNQFWHSAIYRTVQPKMKIVLLITHPHVFSNS